MPRVNNHIVRLLKKVLEDSVHISSPQKISVLSEGDVAHKLQYLNASKKMKFIKLSLAEAKYKNILGWLLLKIDIIKFENIRINTL